VRDFSAKPILIGTQLDTLHLGSKADLKPLYAALISSDISGDVTYTKNLFFSYLQPHKLIKGTEEILFGNSILLNISDILNCLESIPVDIQQLLYDGDKLGSTYSFWKNANNSLRYFKQSSLMLTKSRIPGDKEHFWIVRLEDGYSNLEVFLEDHKSMLG
jgi:hypothetical protein